MNVLRSISLLLVISFSLQTVAFPITDEELLRQQQQREMSGELDPLKEEAAENVVDNKNVTEELINNPQEPSDPDPILQAKGIVDPNTDASISQDEMKDAYQGFIKTYGKSSGEDGFDAAYDFDGDTDVDEDDWNSMKTAIGQCGGAGIYFISALEYFDTNKDLAISQEEAVHAIAVSQQILMAGLEPPLFDKAILSNMDYDFKNDGQITLTDSVIALRLAVVIAGFTDLVSKMDTDKTGWLSAEELKTASSSPSDLNNDGVVNDKDAEIVQQFAKELEVNLIEPIVMPLPPVSPEQLQFAKKIFGDRVVSGRTLLSSLYDPYVRYEYFDAQNNLIGFELSLKNQPSGLALSLWVDTNGNGALTLKDSNLGKTVISRYSDIQQNIPPSTERTPLPGGYYGKFVSREIIYPDGRSELYDSNNRLIQIVDPMIGSLDIDYSNPASPIATFTPKVPAGVPATERKYKDVRMGTAGAGEVFISFGYVGKLVSTKITFPDGRSETRDAQDRLTQIVDPMIGTLDIDYSTATPTATFTPKVPAGAPTIERKYKDVHPGGIPGSGEVTIMPGFSGKLVSTKTTFSDGHSQTTDGNVPPRIIQIVDPITGILDIDYSNPNSVTATFTHTNPDGSKDILKCKDVHMGGVGVNEVGLPFGYAGKKVSTKHIFPDGLRSQTMDDQNRLIQIVDPMIGSLDIDYSNPASPIATFTPKVPAGVPATERKYKDVRMGTAGAGEVFISFGYVGKLVSTKITFPDGRSETRDAQDRVIQITHPIFGTLDIDWSTPSPTAIFSPIPSSPTAPKETRKYIDVILGLPGSDKVGIAFGYSGKLEWTKRTFPDGRSVTSDSQNRITQIFDPNIGTLDIDRSTSSPTATFSPKITDPQVLRVITKYENLVMSGTPGSTNIAFGYAGTLLSTTIIYRDGAITITLPDGTVQEMDNNGRVTRQVSPNGTEVKFIYAGTDPRPVKAIINVPSGAGMITLEMDQNSIPGGAMIPDRLTTENVLNILLPILEKALRESVALILASGPLVSTLRLDSFTRNTTDSQVFDFQITKFANSQPTLIEKKFIFQKNNLKSVVHPHPDGTSETYEYDAAGKIKSITLISPVQLTGEIATTVIDVSSMSSGLTLESLTPADMVKIHSAARFLGTPKLNLPILRSPNLKLEHLTKSTTGTISFELVATVVLINSRFFFSNEIMSKYVATLSDGTVETFNAVGKLTELIKPNVGKYTITWPATGFATAIFVSADGKLTKTWTAVAQDGPAITDTESIVVIERPGMGSTQLLGRLTSIAEVGVGTLEIIYSLGPIRPTAVFRPANGGVTINYRDLIKILPPPADHGEIAFGYSGQITRLTNDSVGTITVDWNTKTAVFVSKDGSVTRKYKEVSHGVVNGKNPIPGSLGRLSGKLEPIIIVLPDGTYEYDDQDRLIKISLNDFRKTVIEFFYDIATDPTRATYIKKTFGVSDASKPDEVKSVEINLGRPLTVTVLGVPQMGEAVEKLNDGTLKISQIKGAVIGPEGVPPGMIVLSDTMDPQNGKRMIVYGLVKIVILPDGTTQEYDAQGRIFRQVSNDTRKTTLEFIYTTVNGVEQSTIKKTFGVPSSDPKATKEMIIVLSTQGFTGPHAVETLNDGTIIFYKPIELVLSEPIILQPNDVILVQWLNNHPTKGGKRIVTGKIQAITLPNGTVQQYDIKGRLIKQISNDPRKTTLEFTYYGDTTALLTIKKTFGAPSSNPLDVKEVLIEFPDPRIVTALPVFPKATETLNNGRKNIYEVRNVQSVSEIKPGEVLLAEFQITDGAGKIMTMKLVGTLKMSLATNADGSRTVTYPNGVVDVFSSAGMLIKHTDAKGTLEIVSGIATLKDPAGKIIKKWIGISTIPANGDPYPPNQEITQFDLINFANGTVMGRAKLLGVPLLVITQNPDGTSTSTHYVNGKIDFTQDHNPDGTVKNTIVFYYEGNKRAADFSLSFNPRLIKKDVYGGGISGIAIATTALKQSTIYYVGNAGVEKINFSQDYNANGTIKNTVIFYYEDGPDVGSDLDRAQATGVNAPVKEKRTYLAGAIGSDAVSGLVLISKQTYNTDRSYNITLYISGIKRIVNYHTNNGLLWMNEEYDARGVVRVKIEYNTLTGVPLKKTTYTAKGTVNYIYLWDPVRKRWVVQR